MSDTAIRVDSRVGSRELLAPLLALGASAELAVLEFGDFAWVGEGPDGLPLPIGVERKRLQDFCSSLASGRLQRRQIPGMVNTFAVPYLLLEGTWRENDGRAQWHTGKRWAPLQIGESYITVRTLLGAIETLRMHTDMRIVETSGVDATTLWLVNTQAWWQRPWTGHGTHKSALAGASPSTMSLVRRVSDQLPGIGYTRALAIARRWRTVHEMVNASLEDWRTVEGVGEVTATKLYNALRGTHHAR